MAIFTDKKPTKNNYISIKDLSEKLSVSRTTVKNWIKLNKIQPSFIENSQILFTKDYTDKLIKQLNSDNSNLLKSRRNKKYISGSFFYKDYISESSKNTKIIEELLNYITNESYNLSAEEIKYIIADCAIQLILQKNNPNKKLPNKYLSEYLKNKINLGIYAELINDLIDNRKNANEFVQNYSDIFKNYIYEKNQDILGLLYISLSDLNNRKASGTYYTPTKVVKKIIHEINFEKFSDITILDPCCGAGNFLLQLPDNLNIEQIYGNDIDNTAIQITRLNMALKFNLKNTKILYKNFTDKNFLLNNIDKKFDYIIGNPPWGANFDSDTIKILQKKYLTAQNKNIESYDIFVEKSISSLKLNGNILFVIPEAILTVKSHKPIRKIICNKNSIKYIEFLGNMFDKVQCPSIILQIEHTNKNTTCAGMKIVNKNKEFFIKKERKITPEVFDFSMNDKQYEIYKKIFAGQKVYLKNNAIFALGIVTGDNKKYITDKKTVSNEIILKGSDIEKFKIKKTSNYIEYTPEKFQQTAPTEIYRAKEKLFYKFISKKLIFAYDNKKTLSLNSCNILIPKINNMNIKYVMAILNSKIAQFIFEKKYNSVKVLRTHLENIPIPICNNETQNEIINIVDTIINNDKNQNDLLEILEEKIYKLYDLTKQEYNVISDKQ